MDDIEHPSTKRRRLGTESSSDELAANFDHEESEQRRSSLKTTSTPRRSYNPSRSFSESASEDELAVVDSDHNWTGGNGTRRRSSSQQNVNGDGNMNMNMNENENENGHRASSRESRRSWSAMSIGASNRNQDNGHIDEDEMEDDEGGIRPKTEHLDHSEATPIPPVASPLTPKAEHLDHSETTPIPPVASPLTPKAEHLDHSETTPMPPVASPPMLMPPPPPPPPQQPLKPEQINYREKYLLRGHLRGVSAVQFSRDGSMIASGGMYLWHCIPPFTCDRVNHPPFRCRRGCQSLGYLYWETYTHVRRPFSWNIIHIMESRWSNNCIRIR